ncbi:MAG TPA: response regulator [Geobacteraceae bacterium]|jgi:CheY-like chemotaxis protein
MKNTILLVDDVQMYLELEKDFLKHTSINILTAKDGLEALDILKANRPDLIFMDLQMPRMDGIACCKAIKSDPELFAVPVVIVTLQGKKEDEQACYSAGCDLFMTKPLDRDRFLEAARRFISGTDRREKRIPTRINGTLRDNGNEIPCIVRDVSAGGAYVETGYSGKTGLLHISFTLPDGTAIGCHGKVVWTNETPSKHPVGFGVKFAMLSKPAKEALGKFIEDEE